MLTPPAALIACLCAWGVNVFIWDEWLIWSKLLSALDSGIELADLTRFHNEHRSLIPRLLALANLTLASGSRVFAMALNVLAAAGVACLAWRLLRKTYAHAPRWAFALIAYLSFSLTQWETFTIGLNNCNVFTVLGALGGALLISPRMGWTRFATLLALMAPLSMNMANGLFLWPAFAVQLWLMVEDKRTRARYLMIWAVAAILAWSLYLHGYVRPAHHPPLLDNLANPLAAAGYWFAFLGSPLVTDANLAIPAMACSVAGALAAAWAIRTLRSNAATLRSNAGWLALLAFTALSAAATAAGRASLGLDQAVESRYATTANLFWFSALALTLQAAPIAGARFRRYATGTLCACLALFLLGSILSAIVMRNRAHSIGRARDALYGLTDDAALKRIFPVPEYLKAIQPMFLERRLPPYASLKRLNEYALNLAEPSGGVELTAYLDAPAQTPGDATTGRLPGLRLSGWAVDPRTAEPATLVLVALDEKLAAVCRPTLARPDKCSALVDDRCGFACFVPYTAFSGGEQPLRVYALSRDQKRLAPLSCPLDVARMAPAPLPDFGVERYFASGGRD